MSGFNPLAGPGSQPGEDDGAELQYMEMPKDMRTYTAPALPEPGEVSGITDSLAILAQVRDAARSMDLAGPPCLFDITGLDDANRAFVDQVLGDGEVSIVAGATVQVQESVLAGIWRVHEVEVTGALKRDTIEVGAFPALVRAMADEATLEGLRPHRGALPAGVTNAGALVTELDDRLAAYRPGMPAHAVNLTLLPLTDEDQTFLDERIGTGTVTVLSRGYGNCRITSTLVRNAWRVRYFNSRDTVVLDTIEVVDVPSVACAAIEDLRDSAGRLTEILEVYR
jgi:hydrogenase-1 operon protein HyaF